MAFISDLETGDFGSSGGYGGGGSVVRQLQQDGEG